MYSIAVDLPVTLPQGSPLPAAFPHLHAAVAALARLAHERWIGYATGTPLPDGRSINARSGAYARSIKMVQLSDFAYRVESDSPYAAQLEQGSPPRDMKLMLRTSMKVRISKDGKRYLIIPFRHGTPGSVAHGTPMPSHVHEQAKELRASRVVGAMRVPSATGVHDIRTRSPVMVTRRQYNWGDRLPGSGPKGRAQPGERHAGMYRFDEPVGGGHSKYMTFRVMSEASAGWWRKAVPGYWPARTTADEVRRHADAVCRAALAADLQRALGGAS